MSPEADPPEVYLIHGDIAYFLKVDSLFTPLGVGAKFKVREGELLENLLEYGFRQLSVGEMEKLFEDLPSPLRLRRGRSSLELRGEPLEPPPSLDRGCEGIRFHGDLGTGCQSAPSLP